MTVIARRIVASPVRTASEVWRVIVDLVAPVEGSEARTELNSIAGVACSLVAAEAMLSAPIIVKGKGPRVRIYCLYYDDAIVGEKANEKALPADVTSEGWSMSLPCPAEDLDWVQPALASHSRRVTARDMAAEIEDDTTEDAKTESTIDEEAFLRS